MSKIVLIGLFVLNVWIMEILSCNHRDLKEIIQENILGISHSRLKRIVRMRRQVRPTEPILPPMSNNSGICLTTER